MFENFCALVNEVDNDRLHKMICVTLGDIKWREKVINEIIEDANYNASNYCTIICKHYYNGKFHEKKFEGTFIKALDNMQKCIENPGNIVLTVQYFKKRFFKGEKLFQKRKMVYIIYQN